MFDVIVTNPPYQLPRGSHPAYMPPLYPAFVFAALQSCARLVSMIIPAKWFGAPTGKRMREAVLAGDHLRTLVDFEDGECTIFPSAAINGGVCYFVHDKHHSGPCEFTSHTRAGPERRTARLASEAGGLVVRSAIGLRILNKVRAHALPPVFVGPWMFFGLQSNFSGYATAPSPAAPVELIRQGPRGFVGLDQLAPRSRAYVDRWKALLPYAGGPEMVLSAPFTVPPGTACTQSFLSIGECNSQAEAEAMCSYLRTRFLRLLVRFCVAAPARAASHFRFVPALPAGRTEPVTDAELYERFGLDAEEIAYIERVIPPRS